jgi:hypothetical protein
MKLEYLIFLVFSLCFSLVKAQTPTCLNPPCNQYVALQEKLDGTFQTAYHKTLWIKYEEFYGDTNTTYLCFSIYDEDRNLLYETKDDGTRKMGCNLSPVPKKYGLNWLQIPLPCTTIENEKFYYLEVWNVKGEKFYLRFYALSNSPSE